MTKSLLRVRPQYLTTRRKTFREKGPRSQFFRGVVSAPRNRVWDHREFSQSDGHFYYLFYQRDSRSKEKDGPSEIGEVAALGRVLLGRSNRGARR